jgi:hypothetical protein
MSDEYSNPPKTILRLPASFSKDNPCLFFIMLVEALPVIAIVIDLPSFLFQKFRQEIRLIVTESNFSAIWAARLRVSHPGTRRFDLNIRNV